MIVKYNKEIIENEFYQHNGQFVILIKCDSLYVDKGVLSFISSSFYPGTIVPALDRVEQDWGEEWWRHCFAHYSKILVGDKAHFIEGKIRQGLKISIAQRVQGRVKGKTIMELNKKCFSSGKTMKQLKDWGII
jgi:hypothetical protein